MDTRVGNVRRFGLINHRVDQDAFIEAIEGPQRTLSTAASGVAGSGMVDGGAAFHNIGGIASPIEVTFTNGTGPDTCAINFPSPAIFFIAGLDVDGRPVAKYLNYEPGSTAQTATSIDLTGVMGDPCILWCRRGENPLGVDADNQVNWDLGEQFTSPNIRYMEYVDFYPTGDAGDAERNDPANGWAPFGRISVWPVTWPADPAVQLFDPVDAIRLSAAESENFMVYPRLGAVPAGWALGIEDHRGLPRLLKTVVNAMVMQNDSNNEIDGDGTAQAVGDLGYYRRYQLGHKQLDYKLVDTNQGIAGGTITWNGSAYEVEAGAWAAPGMTVSVSAGGNLNFSSSDAARQVYGYSITPSWLTSAIASDLITMRAKVFSDSGYTTPALLPLQVGFIQVQRHTVTLAAGLLNDGGASQCRYAFVLFGS